MFMTTDTYVQLNNFLKIKWLLKTGGEAKVAIRREEVTVDGQVETRVKKKLYLGAVVKYNDTEHTVKEDVLIDKIKTE